MIDNMRPAVKPAWYMNLLRTIVNKTAAWVDTIAAWHPRGTWRSDPSHDDPRVETAWWDGYRFAVDNAHDPLVYRDIAEYGTGWAAHRDGIAVEFPGGVS